MLSVSQSPYPDDPDERSYLQRLFFWRNTHDDVSSTPYPDEEHGVEHRPGLPKVSRECLIAEIKCYGSYILPVFLVFVVLVLAVSLSIFFHYRR